MGQRMIRAGVAAAALAALAGCDGAFEFEEVAGFDELSDSFEVMEARVEALPITTAGELPVAGQATYRGFAGLEMETPEPTQLFGTAAITTDFGDRTLSGELGGFTGRVNGGGIERLDGTLEIANGSIAVLTPSDLTAELSGTLTGDGGAIGVDGSILGSFRTDGGQGAGALAAVAAPGTDMTLDGAEFDGTLGIVAER